MITYHNTLATHRCGGSLKQYMSIHYCNPYPEVSGRDNYNWWLLRADQDFESGTWYLQPICQIDICPFCGEHLLFNPEESQKNISTTHSDKSTNISTKDISTLDLNVINTFETTPLKAHQVFVFAVKLCDNEIDKDYERFDYNSLLDLSKLFVGKVGILDERYAVASNLPRIYCTELIPEPGKVTSNGAQYFWLKGLVYVVRSEENKRLISEIESGKKKEVSVGCSIAKSVCSICGKDIGSCDHIKGEFYDGKLCFWTLKNPVEVYEWSFVKET